MNDQFVKLLLKYNDRDINDWLINNHNISLKDLVNHRYIFQIGLLLDYLFEYHHISISYDGNMVIIIYHNPNKEVLSKDEVSTNTKSYIKLTSIGISKPIKNRYSPF